MQLTDRVVIPPPVISRAVGDETVLLDLATGTYFGLNPVGARIWELMSEGKTLAEVRDAMSEEYQVSRTELERDVLTLAQNLLDQRLIKLPE